jgi:hypothetical protein
MGPEGRQGERMGPEGRQGERMGPEGRQGEGMGGNRGKAGGRDGKGQGEETENLVIPHPPPPVVCWRHMSNDDRRDLILA